MEPPGAAAGGLNDGHHALNVLIEEELPDGMVRVTTKASSSATTISTEAITTTSCRGQTMVGAS
jgi:hypothetical protein